MNKNKVLVAMSGGVDSTVCAHLIKSSGYLTEGITMKLWSENEVVNDDRSPSPDQNITDAQRAANGIGIPHHSIALGDTFKTCVISPFIDGYLRGKTPNPCVDCNRTIKFGTLMDICNEFGFDYLATGHYARIEKDNNGNFVLRKAIDTAKDQSYFLWSIKKEYLSRILFPLGTYTKEEIREIARQHNYESAHRSDSQDICFIPSGDYAAFIKSNTCKGCVEGDFISSDGKVIGRHQGIINYTVGQRKGLGVAFGKPMFVGRKNVENNTVMLCSDDELYSSSLTAHSLNFLVDHPIDEVKKYQVKIRYRHTPVYANVILLNDDKMQVIFDTPQRAVTPGQSVVIYDGDTVIGGGIIE